MKHFPENNFISSEKPKKVKFKQQKDTWIPVDLYEPKKDHWLFLKCKGGYCFGFINHRKQIVFEGYQTIVPGVQKVMILYRRKETF